jgi:predicted patatin/cPLA2 family phospholipase
MRGSVSAGMCIALEAAGLIRAFDRIYGCSAGALNGAFTAAGQAQLAALTYVDSASRRFIDGRRLLRGRPVVDLDLLFDELIARKRPFSSTGLASGPEFRALAVSARTRQLRVLSDLRSPEDALRAVRASCSVPLLNGVSQSFRGERLVDGGFVESVPYRSAVRDGATHMLVLRSRPAGYRLPPHGKFEQVAMNLASPRLVSLLRTRPAHYNSAADELEALAAHARSGPAITQVTVPEDCRLADYLTTDAAQIRACLDAGAAAVEAFLERSEPPLEAAA